MSLPLKYFPKQIFEAVFETNKSLNTYSLKNFNLFLLNREWNLYRMVGVKCPVLFRFRNLSPKENEKKHTGFFIFKIVSLNAFMGKNTYRVYKFCGEI